MIRQRALDCWVVIAFLLGCCVAEPDGIRPATSSVEPTGGQPAELEKTSDACEALRIVVDKCGRCHGAPPEHGAPFSLTSYEDLQEVDAKGLTRRERAAAAVERGDMPAGFIELEPPVEELGDEEREALLSWLREGEEPGEPCD
jgi:mono/diheme cytochrome c family protein